MTIELPKLSIAVALLALPFSASAGWEIGAESVTPTGDFSDIAGGGGGLYVQHVSTMNENVLLTGYLGALAYGGIDIFGVEVQWYGYPLTTGMVYYPNGVEEGGPFVKANAGTLFKLSTVTYLGDEESESETGFVLSPGVGWDFGSVNVTADYNIGNDSWTWMSVKAAFRFGM